MLSRRDGNPLDGPSRSRSPIMASKADMASWPPEFSLPRRLGDPSQLDSIDDFDIEHVTEEAIQDWVSIRQAFEAFSTQLGSDFEPLGAELTDLRYSPFGQSLQYRTFSVAGIWMSYYMGLICLYRAHPSAPPIGLLAAGSMESQTAEYANIIGRVAVGMVGDITNVTKVSSLIGAALTETCFCLFIAGIQVGIPVYLGT